MPSKSAQFTWQLGAEPPSIEAHTDAKLRLLQTYLDGYFDVVCAFPQMDVLRIALVDAFAGGGMFRRNGTERYGSPLVMIDAVRRAEARINASRRKPLRIDAKFYFVDSDANAVDYLRGTLATSDIPQAVRDAVTVRNATASAALPVIVREISNWSRAGRSLFFLDQCGYSDAPNRDVRLIYQSLPKSEVIATYNFGSIYDYMNDNAPFLSATAPVELTADRIRALLRERDRQAGRFFAGRLLGRMFKESVGSRFASRFFLRSDAAHRDMWFVHYSKVPRSRLVMSDAHWSTKNSSITQGEAGLDMLGFRPGWEDQIGLDFGFDHTDEGRMHTALVAELPAWLDQFDDDSAPTFDTLLTLSADRTAATEAQFNAALRGLEADHEIDVLTPSGSPKRPNAKIHAQHRIRLAHQGNLF